MEEKRSENVCFTFLLDVMLKKHFDKVPSKITWWNVTILPPKLIFLSQFTTDSKTINPTLKLCI
jgi:hypothetical protein